MRSIIIKIRFCSVNFNITTIVVNNLLIFETQQSSQSLKRFRSVKVCMKAIFISLTVSCKKRFKMLFEILIFLIFFRWVLKWLQPVTYRVSLSTNEFDSFFFDQSQALLGKYFNINFSDCVNVNSHSGIYDASGNRK